MIELRSRYQDTSNRHRNRPCFNQLRSAGKALKDIGLNDGMGAYFGTQFIEHAGRASANALLL
ncbi:MAG: hypothetical protein GTO15_18355, partial [Pseudomonas stutzeri]|nr:hypothetical protein [Stutzerimonas stutzeri]